MTTLLNNIATRIQPPKLNGKYIRIQDAEHDVDYWERVDEQGNFRFPDRCEDIEINGTPLKFVGWSSLWFLLDENFNIQDVRSQVIAGIEFGSVTNISIVGDISTNIPEYYNSPTIVQGGLFAVYGIPSFFKYQFYTDDKQLILSDDNDDVWLIKCRNYCYIFAPIMENGRDYNSSEPFTLLSGMYEHRNNIRNTGSWKIRKLSTIVDTTSDYWVEPDAVFVVDVISNKSNTGNIQIVDNKTIIAPGWDIQTTTPFTQWVYTSGGAFCSVVGSIVAGTKNHILSVLDEGRMIYNSDCAYMIVRYQHNRHRWIATGPLFMDASGYIEGINIDATNVIEFIDTHVSVYGLFSVNEQAVTTPSIIEFYPEPDYVILNDQYQWPDGMYPSHR